MRSEQRSFSNRTSTGDVIPIMWDEIECAARSDTRVLITGQTGVSRDVLATLMHRMSPRRLGPIAMLNCAGLPDSLLESELFGHVRGSVAGAYGDKVGLLELAANGTLFLDEVGELSPRMQDALFRFLETGEVQRVGADRPHIRVNVRLMTGTNRDLTSRMSKGTFRQDLYYRLNVIRIHTPRVVTAREPSSIWSTEWTAES